MARAVQIPLIPPRPLSAKERRALIRERLHGFEVRQRAREQRRREARERRQDDSAPGSRQMTLADVLGR